MCVFQNEPNPAKVARARSTSKQMIACFFRKTGHVAIVALEQRRTVNSEWYITICLPTVVQEIRKTNRRRRITLHHDNASSHTSEKPNMSQTYHQNNAEQSILTGTQPLVCQLSSKKLGKPTAEDGSFFTMTMRAVTHRLKQLHF